MTFPDYLTFENGLRLRRVEPEAFPLHALTTIYMHATCYQACKLFCGCDADDMNAIDDKTYVTGDLLNLNDGDGYADETNTCLAVALGMTDQGVPVITVCDQSLENLASYVQSFQ